MVNYEIQFPRQVLNPLTTVDEIFSFQVTLTGVRDFRNSFVTNIVNGKIFNIKKVDKINGTLYTAVDNLFKLVSLGVAWIKALLKDRSLP